jgi:diacylglycerol kinase family enzyme
MRAVLFHNPGSGTKNNDKDNILAALKLADIDATYVSTKSDELDDAFKKHADLYIAAGGDGTIRTVITGARDRDVPIAILPLGTANNVARSLGIAGTPQELVETWNLDHTVPLDIGSARGAWGSSTFIESFGVGLMPAYLLMAAKHKKPEGADNLLQGRKLIQKALKHAKPVDVEITIGGKKLDGEFLGVEVLNIPFTGPGLPLGERADAADGRLDVVCFEADRAKELSDWIDAPLDEPPPVLCRKASEVRLLWRDAPNRLDDKSFDNEETTQTAELTCEDTPACVLMPRKLRAQKAHEEKAETA